ncbi:MAG: PD40 domain-containing protein [Lewinellaceae bacterium]|nr:PD40 domain-containing protein [Lewinellaceae bacterium]
MKKVILLLLLVASMTSVGAQKSLRGLNIAYNTLENKEKDDYDIYVMQPDGSGKTNITQNPDVAWTYFAYADKLYWISDRDTCYRCYYLYESDAKGQTIRKVSGLRLEDSWMSARNKGRELIVTGRLNKDVRGQLFVIDVSTGAFRQITQDTAARYNDPVFSPDGSQIVYRYKKNKRDRDEKAELWISNADGSAARQLTHYPAGDTTASWHSYHAGAPHWNAQRNLITYQSKQGGRYRLFAVSPDGKKQFEWPGLPGNMGAGWHDWSPDGRWLAIELFPDEDQPGDIYLFDAKKKTLKQITDGPGYEYSPVWVKQKANSKGQKTKGKMQKFIE